MRAAVNIAQLEGVTAATTTWRMICWTAYTFSEDEQEERILQAIERSGYFATPQYDEDCEEPEDSAEEDEDRCVDGETTDTAPRSTEPMGADRGAIGRKTHRLQSGDAVSSAKSLSTPIKPTQSITSRSSGETNSRLQYMSIPKTYLVPTQTTATARSSDRNNAHQSQTTEESNLATASTQQYDRSSRKGSSTLQQQPPPLQSQISRGTQQQQQHAALVAITTPWVRQFLSNCHRDILLPVPKDYCADNFNLVQLPPVIEKIGNSVPHVAPTEATTKPFPVYRQALKLLTQDEPLPASIPEHIDQAATALYLILHQRYVVSPRGLDMVRRRFLVKAASSAGYSERRNSAEVQLGHCNDVDPIFGRCPTLACQGMPLLPIGDSDSYQCLTRSLSSSPLERFEETASAANRRAKRYCASCRQVYFHWDSKVDGCAWGTSFCHLFLMVCGNEVFGDWSRQPNRQRQQDRSHVARIFGFKLHPSAQQ